MDPSHHQPAMSPEGYPFFHHQEHQEFIAPYTQIAPFPGVQQSATNPSHMQQQIQHFDTMGMIQTHQFPATGVPYGSPTTPDHPHAGLPPPSPTGDAYDPLSPPISGSDTSADGLYHHNSSASNSPSSSRHNSLVHRHRYNPTPSPTSSSGRRSRGHSHDSDDDESRFGHDLIFTRKEATRRQRIQAEQKRRDDLRDGYAKLKGVLPISNTKSSKVSLLERATIHISSLEDKNKELLTRVEQLEKEVAHLRALNEKITFPAGETPSPGMFDARPLSPPPDVPPVIHLTGHKHAEPASDESSLSDIEGDY